MIRACVVPARERRSCMSGYAQRGFDPEVKKFLNFIGVIVGFAGYSVLRALGVPMPVLLIVFVIAGIAGGIGWVIGRVLSRFVDGDGAFALCLACSLLVAWFVPPVGIALSIVVCELASTASNRRMFLLC